MHGHHHDDQRDPFIDIIDEDDQPGAKPKKGGKKDGAKGGSGSKGEPLPPQYEGYILKPAPPEIGKAASWTRVGKVPFPVSDEQLVEKARAYRRRSKTGKTAPMSEFKALSTAQQSVINRLIEEHKFNEKNTNADWVLVYAQPTYELNRWGSMIGTKVIEAVLKRQDKSFTKNGDKMPHSSQSLGIDIIDLSVPFAPKTDKKDKKDKNSKKGERVDDYDPLDPLPEPRHRPADPYQQQEQFVQMPDPLDPAAQMHGRNGHHDQPHGPHQGHPQHPMDNQWPPHIPPPAPMAPQPQQQPFLISARHPPQDNPFDRHYAADQYYNPEEVRAEPQFGYPPIGAHRSRSRTRSSSRRRKSALKDRRELEQANERLRRVEEKLQNWNMGSGSSDGDRDSVFSDPITAGSFTPPSTPPPRRAKPRGSLHRSRSRSRDRPRRYTNEYRGRRQGGLVDIEPAYTHRRRNSQPFEEYRDHGRDYLRQRPRLHQRTATVDDYPREREPRYLAAPPEYLEDSGYANFRRPEREQYARDYVAQDRRRGQDRYDGYYETGRPRFAR